MANGWDYVQKQFEERLDDLVAEAMSGDNKLDLATIAHVLELKLYAVNEAMNEE